ncbi:hypothetical protein CF336_g5413 [Tilletia laevis]|nr:hypothetical protein CF336_g5413 [Tilletia laevis]
MSTQDQTTSPRPGATGADNASQRQPSLADIFNAVTDIRERVSAVEQDLAAQRHDLATQRAAIANLVTSSALTYEESALMTPPGQTAGGIAGQGAPRVPEHQPTMGPNPAAPPVLQPGHAGGPFGLTPVVLDQERRYASGRISMGVSGFPLPPQAIPAPHRGQTLPQTQKRGVPTPYRSAPRDSDPTLKGVKEDLFVIHQDYYRSVNASWTDEQVDREATRKTAEDYLAMRRRAIEDTLAGTAAPAKSVATDSGRPYRRVNWDMVKIITKLSMENWSDWRSSIYSLLGTVPGAIGILEGTIWGPRYLDPSDYSSHPDYDEALDLELGQVIQSCTEPGVKSLLLKTTSEQELRGSFFYRDLRVWLVPNQGYAALKLIAQMGRHRQREDESVKEFGERLRRFYLELQSAGENLDQTKQVGFFLAGLRLRFQTARDSVVSRQAAGEAFTFEKALRILAETEESFDAFDDRRRGGPTARPIPPLSRPSAHFAEEGLDEFDLETDGDDEDIQAFAAQFARQFIARRKAGYGRPFNGACFICKKTGHRVSDCQQNQETQGQGQAQPGSTARALAAEANAAPPTPSMVHTCGKDSGRASYANGVPAIGAFEAQVWEDELNALPSALNVVASE